MRGGRWRASASAQATTDIKRCRPLHARPRAGNPMAHSQPDIFPATITPLYPIRLKRTPKQRTMPLPERQEQPPVTDDGGQLDTPPSEMTGVGWTQIPNSWLEALGRPDNGITLREMRWLCALMRATWGYHRNWVELTRAEIAATSGYDLENCHRLVSNLVKAGLLRVERRPGKASRFALAEAPPAKMTGVPAPVTGVQKSKKTGARGRKTRGKKTTQPTENTAVSKKPPKKLSTDPPPKLTGGTRPTPADPPPKLTGGPPPQIDGGYGSGFACDSGHLAPEKNGLKKTLKKDLYISLSDGASPAWAEVMSDATGRERRKIASGLQELHRDFPNDGGLLDAAPRLASAWGVPDGGPVRSLIGLMLHSWPRVRDYWREQEAKAERTRHQRRGSEQQAEAEDQTALAEQAAADAAFEALTPVEQDEALRRHAGIFDVETTMGALAARASWWQHEGSVRV